MASPLWRHPGTRCGRITPRRATAQGTEQTTYYGFVYYTYSYAYDYYAGRVFCLGSDDYNQVRRFNHGDIASVAQASVDTTNVDLIYFCWRLVTKNTMPAARTLCTGKAVTFKTSDLIITGDTSIGFVLPSNAEAFLQSGEADLALDVSGTANNNGIHELTGVPWGQGSVVNGRVALLGSTVVAEAAGAATVKLLGCKWTAKGYIDDILRVELEEKPGRSWQRNYMALHCSKLNGLHTVKFTLELDGQVAP